MSKDEMIAIIDSSNEDGLRFIEAALGAVAKNESCSIHTSPERLEEIREEQQRREAVQIEADKEYRFKASINRYNRQESKIGELTGADKKFFESVRNFEINHRYDITYNEIMLLTDVYENSMINAMSMVYKCGYMRGQRAYKNMLKKSK